MVIYWNMRVGKDFGIFCFIAFISRWDSQEQRQEETQVVRGRDQSASQLGSIASYTISIAQRPDTHTHTHMQVHITLNTH